MLNSLAKVAARSSRDHAERQAARQAERQAAKQAARQRVPAENDE